MRPAADGGLLSAVGSPSCGAAVPVPILHTLVNTPEGQTYSGHTMAEVELSPGRWVGEGRQVYIVAEIGQNHQGQVDTAR